MDGVLFLQRLAPLGSVLPDGRQFVLQLALPGGEAERSGHRAEGAVPFLAPQLPGGGGVLVPSRRRQPLAGRLLADRGRSDALEPETVFIYVREAPIRYQYLYGYRRIF